MPRYSLIESTVNRRQVYGIKICISESEVYTYKYISAFPEEADELIRRMTEGYILPVHFDDIVTDYLAQLHFKKMKINGLY